MKAVIIGAGQIAGGLDSADDTNILTHAHAYKMDERTELVGVCDSNSNALQRFSNKWKVSAFDDIERMLVECSPKIVSICSPTETHGDMIELALKHDSVDVILCEKPLVATRDEFERVNKLLRQSSKKVFVNYIRRFDPSFIQLSQMIQNGEFGELQSFQGRFSKGLIHNGSHMLELIEWLIGSISKIRVLSFQKKENDFLGHFFIETDSAEGVLTNQEATNYDLFELDILFSDAKVSIGDQGRMITIFRPKVSKTFSGYSYLREERRLFGTLEQNMKNALNFALQNDSYPTLQKHLKLSEKLLHIIEILKDTK